MVNALRPTLGPLPRRVGMENIFRANTPEILDAGGTIARRILQVRPRGEDMGAMFVRHMVWSLEQKVGDGTATAAVMFQDILAEGNRYVEAGGNAMRLRVYLEEAMRLILDELGRMVAPIQGEARLRGLAETVCYDPPLAKMLGEIIDIVGEYGRLEIRKGSGRELIREYVEGMYWEEGLLSRSMITDSAQGQAVIENGVVLLTDLSVNEPADAQYILELALQANASGLLLVASSLSDRAMAVFLNPSNWKKVRTIAVKVPGTGLEAQAGALADLAMLTGGRSALRVAHDTLTGIPVESLGRARRIWADKNSFSVAGGKGDVREFRQHIRKLQAAYRRTDKADERSTLLKRIGRLMGGTAVLWVGALHSSDYDKRKALAERTAAAVQSAIREGVVPGGGSAYLACRPALQERLRRAEDLDEKMAYQILVGALEQPFRTLAANAGLDSGKVATCLAQFQPGRGLDVRAKQMVDLADAGIMDSAAVAKEAVRSAVSGAALLLTTDVLVHHKLPLEATLP
jgi:chaperonin GroEL